MNETMRTIGIEPCMALVLLASSLLTLSIDSSPARIGRPDLTIYSADVDPLNIGPGVVTYPDYYDPADYRDQVTTMDFSDDVPEEGQVVLINLTVFNIGVGSGSGKVSFYDGPKEVGAFIGSDNVTVDPFDYDTARASWDTKGATTEDHEIYAYIDPDDPENETNDENNAGSQGIVVNFYPIARITSVHGPGLTPTEGEELTFDASGSTDTQRDLDAGLTYSWRFRDPNSNGTNPDDPTSGDCVVRHVFLDDGTYIVDLKVTDQNGASSNDSATVVVMDRPPVASISLTGPRFDEDSPIVMEAVVDDTSLDLASMVYSWDFGDGSASGRTGSPEVTHSYPFSGDYSITLTVMDDDGASSSAEASVTILNVRPEVSLSFIRVNGGLVDDDGGVITVIEDDAIELGAEANDTASDLPKVDLSWSLDGDRIGMNGTVSFSVPRKGTYDLVAEATDDDGERGAAELVLDVENVPPVADAGPDIALLTDLVVLNGSRSTDTPSDLAGLTYIWDLGGGSTAEGRVVAHSFGEKGDFSIALTVVDDDGESSKDTLKVTVGNIAPRPDVLHPGQVREDETFALDASGSTDPDGDVRSVEWSFEDGSRRSGAVIGHVFHRSGPQRVSVIARDDLGAVSVEDIIIDVVNVDPTADAGGDNETLVGWPITLDGSLSNDTPSDRRNLTFIWDVPGMGRYLGEIVQIVSNVSGEFEASLTVVDDDGRTAVDRLVFIVRDLALSSIGISVELDPDRCGPGSSVTVHGWIDYRYREREGMLDPSMAVVWIVFDDHAYRTVPSPDGRFSHTFKAPKAPGEYRITARSDRFGIRGEGSAVLTVEEGPSWIARTATSPIAIGVGATITIFLIGSAAVLSTDIGRWKLLFLLAPLFSRLSKDKVLENFERGRIYQYILMNPGDHFSHIREMLDLNMGTLTYHLSVLEREEYVRSRTDGMYRRFYPYGMKVEGGHFDIQELILMQLYQNPGMSQKEIADALGVHISTVNYHINMMVGAGLLRHYKRGQVQRYEVEPIPSAIPEAI